MQPQAPSPQAEDVGMLLRHGLIVDGTGRAAYHGDVLLQEGRIAAVGPALEVPAHVRTIDCRDKVVAPGFIDMHSHNDWFMAAADHARFTQPFLRQGITTFVTGNCGFSAAGFDPASPHLERLRRNLFEVAGLDMRWGSVAEYFALLSRQGLTHNLVLLAGHGTIRTALRDFRPEPLTATESRQLLAQLECALEQGAAGISLGLQYEPGIFATPHELRAVAQLVRRHDRILTVHARALSSLSGTYPLKPFGRPHNLQAIEDVLNLARATDVRVQFSHLVFVGRRTWDTLERALTLIDRARGRGIDIRFDTYYHGCGASLIHVVMPKWFLAGVPANYRRKAALLRLQAEMHLMKHLLGFGFEDIVIADALHPDYRRFNGLDLAVIAQQLGWAPFKVFVAIAAASNGQARVVMRHYSTPAVVRELMRHPASLFMTDAWVERAGFQNPAINGAFPGFLQTVREAGTIRLEEAVHKMTGASAARFGLRDRGVLQKGLAADITVFDPRTVRDNTTAGDTDRRPTGVEAVFINGRQALADGAPRDGVRAGRVLRAN